MSYETCRFCDKRATQVHCALLGRKQDIHWVHVCSDHHMGMTNALVELAAQRPWFTLAECHATLNNRLEQAHRWYDHQTGAERRGLR